MDIWSGADLRREFTKALVAFCREQGEQLHWEQSSRIDNAWRVHKQGLPDARVWCWVDNVETHHNVCMQVGNVASYWHSSDEDGWKSALQKRQ